MSVRCKNPKKLSWLIALAILPFPAHPQGDCFYTYRAQVVSVYDADTITVNVDLGFNTWRHNERIRLARIDAPEVTGTEKVFGIPAREYLKSLIHNKTITIKTVKDKKGKFGRYIAEIYLGGENINDLLVFKGFATYREY